MIKKSLAVIFVCFIVLTGCSGKQQSQSSNYIGAGFSPDLAYNDSEVQYEAASPMSVGNNLFTENTPALQETTNRKFTTSSSLKIRIENLDGGVNMLNEIMNRYNTYASSINIDENSRSYTLKVPTQKYKNVLEEIMKIGKILHYEETTEDVTLKYYDLESRLNTKKELIKTFQSYLSKAKNIEEILAVESKIAGLQAEIDDVGRQFILLNNLIEYSTIRLALLGPPSDNNYEKETIGEKIKGVLGGFAGFVSAIAVILVAIIVYVIPSIILLFLLYWVLFGKIGALKKVFKFLSGNKEKGG
jgi:hypothetical protein